LSLKIKRPKLTTYQKAFLYNEARFTITEASTKVGKTFAHIWWIFEMAHLPTNKPNYNYWWCAPVYSQTKIAFNRLRVKVAPSGLYKINESNLVITTPQGVNIHFKSADKPDNLFGEDVYGIVFDEAPRAKVTAFHALRSTITATRGKMKLIGNFGGISNWMHQLKEKALTDPEYAYFKITAWDAVKEGILDEAEILQAQKDLPPKIFKQLYLAEEQENNDMLCTYGAIESLWTNEHVKGTTRYMSADIALHGSDKFVIGVWEGLRLINYIEVDKCDADEVEKLLKKVSEDWKVMRSNIVYDADGLGTFLRGYLRGAIPFNNGGKVIGQVNYKNIKSQCAFKLAEKINLAEIMFGCEIDRSNAIKEIECLQSYELDKDGKIQILPKEKVKEIIGHSPDILDMLIMRMYFEIHVKTIATATVMRRK
jgi:hypothetical protein